MSLDGIGKTPYTPPALNVGKANDALPVSSSARMANVTLQSGSEYRIISVKAENLNGFEEACQNFANITPQDIRNTFKAQTNLDPERISPQDAALTNQIWGDPRGQPAEV